MKKLSLSILVLFSMSRLIAQPNIQWQKCLGGSKEDDAFSIIQTSDGGYVLAGLTQSNDGDITNNHSVIDYSDFWVVKLNVTGSIQWQKCYGGSNADAANSIQQTTDGGYIVAGSAYSNDSDVTANHGGADYWVLKLDSAGSIQWQKCLGGSMAESANSVQQTLNGSYIIAGYSPSTDGNVTGNHGGYSDFWVVSLDSAGSILWQKSYGGSNLEVANSIQQTNDKGYIVAGYTMSNDFDVTGNHGTEDYWVLKLDSAGLIQWQKCYGGSSNDEANSIQQTTDGGYIVAGTTYSNDGDVLGSHGGTDYWIVKLDSTGLIQWQKCIGGSNYDGANSIHQTTDGGYIVAGGTGSNDSDVTGNHSAIGYDDFWLIKLSSAGSIQWQKCLGGYSSDVSTSVKQTTDGGYIVTGFATSNDGDVLGNHSLNGYSDIWVVKLSSTTGIKEISYPLSDISISPNIISYSTLISFSIYQKSDIEIRVHDVAGRLVKSIFHSTLEPGHHSLTWEMNDNTILENGFYLLSILTEGGTTTKMIEVLK